MLVIGALFCTSVVALLLATVFGDVSPPAAAALMSGLLAVAGGLLMISLPAIVRNMTQPMHATRSARQLAHPPASFWMWAISLALTVGGSAAIVETLRTLAVAP